MANAKTITELCNSWRAAVMQPDGSLAIGGESERFRLLANDVAFHNLNYDEMRAACIGLSSVLLLPGRNTVVDQDHSAFWSWCGELICSSRSNYFGQGVGNYPLRSLMELCFRASLVGTYRPDAKGWEQAQALDRMLDVHTQAWKRSGHTALAYLAFPLLEGVAKRHCAEFVDIDGTAVREWSIRIASGKSIRYPIGKRCSSLWSLLELLKTCVASEEMHSDLTQLEEHIATFSDDRSPGFKVLYDWRNGSLHGANLHSTIGGTVLNAAILIALSAFRDNYEVVRQQALEQVQRNLDSGPSCRSTWSFYPPYM